MGDLITFNPNTGSNPVFIGRGSHIGNPDILPIFWGQYWPGSGGMTVGTIMQALNTMASGAYLHGLAQYGYGGVANVRSPRVDQTLCFFGSAPAQAVVDAGADNYINGLIDNDAIDNVDDNNELIVIVFLDPSVPNIPYPGPQGDNGPFVKFDEILDDPYRFQRAWINTSSGQLATVTQILSHELAESISDPFNNGWFQQTPPPAPGAGQIADVCNQNGLSDGIAVTAYWSNADSACIIPTPGVRFVSLSQTTETIRQPDGPSNTYSSISGRFAEGVASSTLLNGHTSITSLSTPKSKATNRRTQHGPLTGKPFLSGVAQLLLTRHWMSQRSPELTLGRPPRKASPGTPERPDRKSR
jgi:hypothetical protein